MYPVLSLFVTLISNAEHITNYDKVVDGELFTNDNWVLDVERFNDNLFKHLMLNSSPMITTF